MRKLVVGLLTLAAAYAVLWNLGALWKLVRLPHNPGAWNVGLGAAVAFFLAIGGAIVWITGAMVLDEGDTPAHLRPPPPPRPEQIPWYPPRSRMTKQRPVPPDNRSAGR